MDDIDNIVSISKEKEIDLVVIGPELPLTLGLPDKLEKEGIKVFGPSSLAAEIEGSKAFSKMIMERYGVPTGKYKVFTDYVMLKDIFLKLAFLVLSRLMDLPKGKVYLYA